MPYGNGNLQLAIPTSRYSNIVTVTCYCNYIDEDSSCKEEKVENIFFKSEIVLKTKVAYFYTPSTSNWVGALIGFVTVSGHNSNHRWHVT